MGERGRERWGREGERDGGKERGLSIWHLVFDKPFALFLFNLSNKV